MCSLGDNPRTVYTAQAAQVFLKHCDLELSLTHFVALLPTIIGSSGTNTTRPRGCAIVMSWAYSTFDRFTARFAE